MCESPDLDFQYEDSDHYRAEIAELYSYAEEPEFTLNRRCYEESSSGHSQYYNLNPLPASDAYMH